VEHGDKPEKPGTPDHSEKMKPDVSDNGHGKDHK
jgi:hypothetical protein